jgi:hypothetical protein
LTRVRGNLPGKLLGSEKSVDSEIGYTTVLSDYRVVLIGWHALVLDGSNLVPREELQARFFPGT